MPWKVRVRQIPNAPRGSANKFAEHGQRKAAALRVAEGTYRACKRCSYARWVPNDNSAARSSGQGVRRQLRCVSAKVGFRGPWRCGWFPAVKTWKTCAEIAADEEPGHNSAVADALAAAQGEYQIPQTDAERLLCLAEVRRRVR